VRAIPLAALAFAPVAMVGQEEAHSHVAGVFDLVLAVAVGAVVAAVFIVMHRRSRKAIEEQSARRIQQMTKLIEHADCMLWEAEVELKPDTWAWRLTLHPSVFSRKLFGTFPSPEVDLWSPFKIDGRAEMDRRARQAMEKGETAYKQEFRAERDGRVYWLHEDVSITPLGSGRFWLVGLVIDNTAQHQAEAAQRLSEQTVDNILEHAQCLLWRANVERGPDDVLNWTHFDIPHSQLSDLLFGERTYQRDRGFWETCEMPDQAAMDVLARQSILGGQSSYSHQFRAVKPGGRIFWLHERVSITRVSEKNWSVVGVTTDITAQHDAEEARRKSDTRLAYLLERADCLVWEATVTVRPDSTLQWDLYTQRSVLYQRIFGHRSETELNWHTVVVPEFQEMMNRARDAVLTRASGYSQEFHVEHPGEVIWLREVVTMVEKAPKIFQLVGVITDITPQKEAEAARRQTEARLQELMARADCLLWEATTTLHADGGWDWDLHVQPSGLCQRLYGFPQPTVADGLWGNFDIPERPQMDERCRNALVGGRSGYEQVFQVRRPGSPAIWISESVSIRPLGENRYSLVGVAVDITATRRAEEALAAEKERLSVTLRAMSESVITTDVSGVIQFMNPAAASLTGWHESESVGRAAADVCQLESNRTEEPVEIPVTRVARGDIVAELPLQTRLVNRHGQRRLIEGCCAPIHAVDSRVIGTVFVFRDVTDQERLEQELIRATRLESVGVLAGGIAHDFNNILTAIMGNLTLAQLDVQPGSPAVASLRSAEKASLRARDLTQQLLTFAKGGDPVRAAVQLDAIVREMTTFALHGSQVKAEFALAPDLWPADADKGQIGRVVQNLVINAVQAMPRGGTLQIAARNEPQNGLSHPALEPGNYIQIAITDTGEGIRAEHLARIFGPYFTTKQSGTGLGLAAVYSIVKKHRGHIEVESQVGKGTTFRIWLPARLEEVERAASRTPWDPDHMKGRVLFMDDEEIIRNMAVVLLQRFGLSVYCASDGAEAVEKYRAAFSAKKPYDLVIMDLTVPGGMGGLAALRLLREIDPGVKAIVSSGYSSDPVLANYRAHGFAAMVAKPYEVTDLARVLREVL
jgi:PAS domain S-box-containing protein